MALISNLRVGVALEIIDGVGLDVISGLINDGAARHDHGGGGAGSGAGTTGCPARENGAGAAGGIKKPVLLFFK